MKHILGAVALTVCSVLGATIFLVWLLHSLSPEYAWVQPVVEAAVGALVIFGVLSGLIFLVVLIGLIVGIHLLEKDRY